MKQEPDPELLNRQPKWFKPAVRWCIIITVTFWVFLVLLFSINNPLQATKKSYQGEAISNAKQIGLALFNFDYDYGSYPIDSTVSLVTTKYPTHGYTLTGKSSNAALLQLMAAEITNTEELFYSNIKGSKKPDGIIIPGKAMEKGEVGFSYITGLSSKDDPATPQILTPLIPGTTKFDPKPFDGKAIILHIDLSVSTHIIAKDGHVYDKGIDILSSKHPIWKGKAPDIRYPE